MTPKNYDVDSLYANVFAALSTKEDRSAIASLLQNPSHYTVEQLIKLLIVATERMDFAGDISDEIRNVEELSRLLKRFSTPEYEAWLDLLRARIHASKGEFEDAVFLNRRVLSNTTIQLETPKIYAYYYLGLAYNHYGATDQAIEHYQQCARKAGEIGNRYIQGHAISNLASIHAANGRHKQALDLIRDAIRLSIDETTPLGPIALRVTECQMLLLDDQIAEAEKIIFPLYEEIIRVNNTVNLSAALGTIGQLYFREENFDKAKEFFHKAIQINRERNRPVLLANTLLALVEVLVKTTEFEEANKCLDEAKEICERVPNSYQVQSCHEITVELRTAEGKYKEALDAFHEYFDAKQKQVSEESERKMQLLHVENLVQQKEREAEIYRVKSEQLEKELMNKTTYLISQSEMLARFKNDLKQIVTETSDPVSGIKRVRDKIKDIQTETINWEEYDKTFSAVHPEFKLHLVGQFPDLTPMETKVCTLLRIELTSKEIAQLLNISERSVENHRYRARKKIGLGDHENFLQFLATL